MQTQHVDEHLYYDNAVIRPPKANSEDKRYTRIVIDSKDRDMDKYPTPTNYEIILYDDVEDVVLAELLTASIPLSGYHINNYHNKLVIFLGSSITNSTTRSDFYVVTLDSGDYTEAGIASHLSSKLTSTTGETFVVSYSSSPSKLIFQSTTTDFIIVTSKTITKPDGTIIDFSDVYTNVSSTSRLLGFSPGMRYTSSSRWFMTPNKLNLSYFNYIVMYIDQFDLNKSSSSILNKSYAIIMSNNLATKVVDDPQIIKKFSPPLTRLTKLTMKFFDRDGNPYDFNGIDHCFEIQFVSYKLKRKYFDIYQPR